MLYLLVILFFLFALAVMCQPQKAGTRSGSRPLPPSTNPNGGLGETVNGCRVMGTMSRAQRRLAMRELAENPQITQIAQKG
jgi:hypothetical protein